MPRAWDGEKSSEGVSIRAVRVRRRDRAGKTDPLPTQTSGETTMQFMLLMKSDQHTEAGVLPDEKIITAMTNYNDALVKAGVLVAAEGLHPTSRGATIRLAGGKRTTT